MRKDYFQHKAQNYEQNPQRVANVVAIAAAMRAKVDFQQQMHILDFGAGTGLLLQQIAPLVQKITAVDISPAMTAVLKAKQTDLGCELDILQLDLLQTELSSRFDGIISSMTLHHIEDIAALLARFWQLLQPGGFIALADLDLEDGSFHTEDTGVFHQGFDRSWLAQLAAAAGFVDISITDAGVVSKPHGDYPLFLLTARR